MVEELGSQIRVTPKKFGGMYDDEHAWQRLGLFQRMVLGLGSLVSRDGCAAGLFKRMEARDDQHVGWLREELRKRTTVMAVVGKVLYVHGAIDSVYLYSQMAKTARGLRIVEPKGHLVGRNAPDVIRFPPALAEGHHRSINDTTRYSLTDNKTGELTDSAREKGGLVGASMTLKREEDEGMTPEDRKKLFNQIDIETWKEMDSSYSLYLGSLGIIFSYTCRRKSIVMEFSSQHRKFFAQHRA